VFEGSLEGGQSDSKYAIFMMEGAEFKVIPVDSWYNFKEKKTQSYIVIGTS